MNVYTSAFETAAAAAGYPVTYSRVGYQNYLFALDDAAVSVSTADDEGPKDAPLRPDTYEYWQPTALSATWTVDLGTDRDIDYVGIAAHTLGSENCTVTVETSPDNAAWTTFADDATPTDDSAIVFLDSVVNARYVRLTITGASGLPRIAVIYVGVALVMQTLPGDGFAPLTLSANTVLDNQISESGQFLAQQIRRNGFRGSIRYRYLERDWVNSYLKPFIVVARNYPFFFSWNPSETSDAVFAMVTRDIVATYTGERDFMSTEFDLIGLGS